MTNLVTSLLAAAHEVGIDLTQEPEWASVAPTIAEGDGARGLPVPQIRNQVESDGAMTFDLVDCDVSIVNALRRTLLADIPVCCIRTETEAVNQCHILVNPTRLHNEILKHRLSCIPVHCLDVDRLPGKIELVVDVTNTSDRLVLVTTEHFRLRHKNGGAFLPDEETRAIFPPCPVTGDFVEFARLRPPLGGGGAVAGERLHLVADFSVATAAVNAMFNVVSTCSYSAAVDWDRANARLLELQQQWKADGLDPHDISLRSHNFKLLEALTFTVPRQWHFVLRPVLFSADHLLRLAFQTLRARMLRKVHTERDRISWVQHPRFQVVTFPDMDYTLGAPLLHALRTLFPQHFCAIFSPHPHRPEISFKVPKEFGIAHFLGGTLSPLAPHDNLR